MTLSPIAHDSGAGHHRLIKMIKRQSIVPLGGQADPNTANAAPGPTDAGGAAGGGGAAHTTANNAAPTTAAAPAAQTTQQAPPTQQAPTTQQAAPTQQAQTTQRQPTQQAQPSTEPAQTRAAATTANTRAANTATSSSTDNNNPRSRSTLSSSSAASLLSLSTSSGVNGPSVVVLSVPTNAFSAGDLSTSAAAAGGTAGASSDGGGPGAGTVVGIVAGGLVGLVVLAGLVGMLLKSRWGKKDEDYQDNPFGDEKDFGRIPDGSDDGRSLLSRSNTATTHQHLLSNVPSLARSGTMASSNSNPNAAINNWRVDPDAPPLPSFQPGQVLLYGPQGGQRTPSPQNPPMAQYNAFPAAAAAPHHQAGGFLAPNGHVAALERAASLAGSRYTPSPAPLQNTTHDAYGNPVIFNGAGAGGGGGAQNLARQASLASAYSRGGPTPAPMVMAGLTHPQAAYNQHHPHPHAPANRPLSLVHEESETAGSARNSNSNDRSGTPTHPNVQQSYFHHRQEDSLGNGTNGTGSVGLGSRENSAGGNEFALFQRQLRADGHLGPAEGVTRQLTNGGGVGGGGARGHAGMGMGREERAKRTLSVRNGGPDDEEDPYGGI